MTSGFRSRAVAALLGAPLVAVTACTLPASSASTVATTTTPADVGAPGEACVIAAAGDVAGSDDYLAGAARTAALIAAARPQKVLALGDLAYDDGTAAEFADYYDPTWGALKAITAPTPGNHEYHSKAKGYFDYFDVPANYAFDACDWHIVSVDQYAGISQAAAFIKKQGAASGDAPMLVFWHEPRFSSGGEHGSDRAVQPLWKAAVNAGADIVLNGHDHDYERFEPLGANGNPHPDGTVEFVSGNGGHHPRALGERRPHSATAVVGAPGALFLTLRPSGYDWSYQDVDGHIGDTGTRELP